MRIVVDHFLPKNNYILANLKQVPEFLLVEDAYKIVTNSSQHSSNFESIGVDDRPEQVLQNLLYSLKNLRKNTDQIDISQPRLMLNGV